MRWYLIDLPYACFAIAVEDGRVTAAAPIGRWMIGKRLETVRGYVAGKNGRMMDASGS